MKNHLLLCLVLAVLQSSAQAQVKKWTGAANDDQWLNTLNWEGQTLPSATDSVVLDHSFMLGAYKVVLPTVLVAIKALTIDPGPNGSIELELPAAGNLAPALQLAGSIQLLPNSQLTNRSAASGASAIQTGDSVYVYNGARYVHRSTSPHAAFLNSFSKSDTCVNGILCFDVPGTASYTLSLSNRVLGKLILQSKAAAAPRTYVATGVNPVQLKGGLEIDSNTTLSYNATSTVHVFGDFILNGILNMGPGANAIFLKLYKSWSGTGQVVESGTGNPFIEWNGTSLQDYQFKGQVKDQISLQSNNAIGISLKQPLTVNYGIRLLKGVIYSATDAPFILDSNATVLADTSVNAAYIDGVVVRKAMKGNQTYLFPIGKDKYQRWIRVKGIVGDVQLVYRKIAASSVTASIDSSLKRVSGVEYWTLTANGSGYLQTELSFNSVNSGGVTNLNALQVAYTPGWMWFNGGNEGTTGSAGASGSVWSDTLPFVSSTPLHLTLASTIKQENPLPIQFLRLYSKPLTESTLIGFTVSSTESIQSFEVEWIDVDGQAHFNEEISIVPSKYTYESSIKTFEEAIGFRVKAKKSGVVLYSSIHRFPSWYRTLDWELKLIQAGRSAPKLYCYSSLTQKAQLIIYSSFGTTIHTQRVDIRKGANIFELPIYTLTSGWYTVSVVAANGERKVVKGVVN